MASLLTPKSHIYQFSTTPLYCWKNLDSTPWDTALSSTNSPGTLVSSGYSMTSELPASANQQLYMKYGGLVECGNGRTIVGAPGWNQSGQSDEGLFELFNIEGNFLGTISNPAGATGGFKFAQTGAIGCDRIVLGPVYTSSTYKLPMYDLEGTFLQYLEAPDGMSGDLSSGVGMWIQEDRVIYSGGTGIMIWDIHGNFLDYIADTSDRVNAGEGLIHAGYGDDMYDMGGQLVNGAILPDSVSTGAVGGICITSQSIHTSMGSLAIDAGTYQEVEESEIEVAGTSQSTYLYLQPYADGGQNNKGRLVAASDNYQFVARSVAYGSSYQQAGGITLHSLGGTRLINNSAQYYWIYPYWHQLYPSTIEDNFGTAISMDLGWVWGGSSYITNDTSGNYPNYGGVAYKYVGASAFTPQQSMWANLS